MSLKRRFFKCRLTDDKFPTLQKKPKCRTCDREVSKIRHDGRRIFGQNVVVSEEVQNLEEVFPILKSRIQKCGSQKVEVGSQNYGIFLNKYWKTRIYILHRIQINGYGDLEEDQCCKMIGVELVIHNQKNGTKSDKALFCLHKRLKDE